MPVPFCAPPFLLSRLRVVLADMAHGSYPVCCSLQCDDISKHLPSSLCIQECEICPQAQVSTFLKRPCDTLHVLW